MRALLDWQGKGFMRPPAWAMAPRGGLLVYRAWGAASSELGSGFFSLEKPRSVLDAELRFNIAEWGNGIHFVSTFRVRHGVEFFVGPVAHGLADVSVPANQIYIEPPVPSKVTLLFSREVLRQDVSVAPRAGHA